MHDRGGDGIDPSKAWMCRVPAVVPRAGDVRCRLALMLGWIMAAGALGTGARYLVGLWAIDRFGTAFPYGTMIVNLVGCFVLGAVAHVATASAWSPELRSAVVIGFLGGFTTYSSFNQDTLTLLSNGSTGAAFVNVAITFTAGLAAGWLGLVAARQLVA